VLPGTEQAMRVREKQFNPDPGSPATKPFLVTWSDPIALGGRGFAFLNELERDGFDIGAPALYRAAVTDHRVLAPKDALAEVHLAIGADIATSRARCADCQVASFDPRTPAQRAESDRLRAEVDRELRARGLANLIPGIDASLYAAATDPRMPADARTKLRRIGDLDLPAAVFIWPATR
jgi:hypothetical protein